MLKDALRSRARDTAGPDIDGFGSLSSIEPAPVAKRARLPAPAVTEPGGTTSSLSRALGVLNLFSHDLPVLRIEDVIAKLGYTRSTAYRYVKELCDADLLTPVRGNRYMLGSRILELERLLELTDPLYRAGRTVLEPLRRDDSVFLLQTLHRDRVLCIHKEGPEALSHDGRRVSLKRARGVPFPLFRGAASLAILAWLSPHRIRQAYLSGSKHIAESGLGHTWPEFNARLSAIRRQGYALSRTGSPMLFSFAVPILLSPSKQVIGSLSHVIPHDVPPAQETASLRMLQAASRDIAAEYARLVSEHDGRAVAPKTPRNRSKA